jgi:hypothetical protein
VVNISLQDLSGAERDLFISNAYRVRSLAYLGLGNVAQSQRDGDFAKSTAFSSPHGSIEDLSFLSQ